MPASSRRSLSFWINVLALDAVVVALVWLPLLAHAAGATMRWGNYVTLGMAVWVVYMLDRLLDGQRVGGPREPRHTWAAQRPALAIAVILAVAMLGMWVGAYHIREVVFKFGHGFGLLSALAICCSQVSGSERSFQLGPALLGGVIIYMLADSFPELEPLSMVWRVLAVLVLLYAMLSLMPLASSGGGWTLPRKVLTGWIFAGAVALAPYAHTESLRSLWSTGPILCMASVCMLNSLAIHLRERSAAVDVETSLLRRLFPILAAISVGGAAAEWVAADAYARPALAASLAGAALLWAWHGRAQKNPPLRFSLVADGILVVCGLTALASIRFLKP